MILRQIYQVIRSVEFARQIGHERGQVRMKWKTKSGHLCQVNSDIIPIVRVSK
jgi:hypothetical protein